MVEQEFPLKAVHMYKKASAIADVSLKIMRGIKFISLNDESGFSLCIVILHIHLHTHASNMYITCILLLLSVKGFSPG